MIFRSIKNKILVSQISLLFLIMGGLGTFSYVTINQILLRHQRENLEIISSVAADAVKEFIDMQSSRFESLADDKIIRIYSEKYQDTILLEFFSKFKVEFPILAYVNKQGMEEFKAINGSSVQTLEDIGNTPFFKKAVSSPNSLTISNLEPSEALGEPVIRLVIAKKSYFSDAFIGMIVGAIPLSHIVKQAAKRPVGETGFNIVYDKEGRILLCPRSGNSSSVIPEGLDRCEPTVSKIPFLESGFTRHPILGIDTIVATAPVAQLEWMVAAALPYQEAFAASRKMRIFIIIISSVVFLLGTIIMTTLSNRIINPLQKLNEAILSAPKGELPQRLEITTRDEVGTLCKSFNLLMTDLAAARVAEQKHISELQVAKEQAESANIAKSRFLATMSHEFRTPLNHIIGFTEMTRDQHFGPITETQAEHLDMVLQSSQHLLSLINDILDLSKVEAGKIELKFADVDLRNLLESSLVMISEMASQRGLALKIDIEDVPETIRADERKLKQIIYNLLSNAVKFTPSGQILLSARRLSRGDLDIALKKKISGETFILFSVQDAGIGMTAENLDAIFELFSQLDSSTSRKYQGAGLGLSLSKKLVELHGGAIWAESDGKGMGSTLSFIIPI